MRGTFVTVSTLLGLLLAACFVAWTVWNEIGEAQIGPHGLIAMTIGCIVTMLLGGGLMWLVYYSHKSGHDDEAGNPDERP